MPLAKVMETLHWSIVLYLSRCNLLFAGVYSVPAIAGLHTSSSVGTMLESLHFQSNRLQFKKFHHFGSAGLEEDEYIECLNQLLQLRECYYEEFDV
ncbi:unnamed protein product [Timema podura]|uniref:Uncharacterized protein n=1 Tax=Timema podura TaxID=61482 RepID=A0ABN7PGE2_TIMPD|nr:unnamed protein product [Timema podura]